MATNMAALDKAIRFFGSQAALAAELGVKQGHVSMWRHRGNLPAEYCPAIERATKGVVRCEQLRPDVDWSVLLQRACP